MRAYRIGQMGRDYEGVGTPLAFRIMDVEGVLAVRTCNRFDCNGLAAFLTNVPDCGIDLARFEVLRQDRLLRKNVSYYRREQRGIAKEWGGNHARECITALNLLWRAIFAEGIERRAGANKGE